MAEPLGTDDIEDVVSSVRRLVSHEARPRPMSRDLGLDKLLLTPALRVVGDVDPVTAALPQPDASPEPKPELPPVADPVAAFVLTVPAEMTDAPPAAVSGEPTAPIADPASPDVLAADLHMVVDGEWEDAFWSEPEPALAELALGAEEAELVLTDASAASSTDDLIVADATDDLEPSEAEAEHGADEELHSLVDGVDLTTAEAEVTRSKPEMSLDVPPQTVAGEDPDDGASPPSGLASSDMAQVLTDQDGNPVTVLDEDALCQIVRLLIREELQGVLGERITHNVRKLVRAEINRALTAHSLD